MCKGRRLKKETTELKWKRGNKRENMTPSHMKCYLIHFTGVLIEGGTFWSPHREENLYTILCSSECSQTPMLRGKLTVCLNCVPRSTNESKSLRYFVNVKFKWRKRTKRKQTNLSFLSPIRTGLILRGDVE